MNPAPAPSLNDLILSAVGGDAWSLESLLIQFHDPLLSYITLTLIAKSNALIPEDILQETLMEAFRSIRTLEPRGPDSFLAWLKSIARTRFLNMLAAQKAQKRGGNHHRIEPSTDPDITAVSILARIANQDPTPSWIARRKEALHAITGALASLDDDRRLLIDLRYSQALPIEEIATRLGKSEGAVKMLLNRTLKELRDLLANNFGESSAGA
jgi:RNA polymerase sigma-70 factor (ECF subfamily)